MKLFTLICVVFAIGSMPAPLIIKVHKFEDGFVERTVAIVVRDKTAHVEYSIGLNESTVRKLLEKWESSSVEGKEYPESANPNVQPSPEIEQFSDKHQASPTGSAGISSSAASAPTKRTDNASGLESTAETNLDSPEKSTSPQQAESKDSNEGHVIAPELLAKFRELAPPAIAKRMKISCNGKPIPITSTESGPPPRHPFTLTVKFQFELPDFKTCDLKINDDNFADQSGAARYALKAAGRSMLIQSDVAPILVRAERVDLSQLSKTERRSRTSVNVRLGIAPPQNK